MIPPVIILHYHLLPGGVTKVIKNQIEAFYNESIDYLVLTGIGYDGAEGIKQTVIPDLDYLETCADRAERAEQLVASCKSAVKERFGEQEVIWYFHNPMLGKSVLWPTLIESLAESNEKLLFHCHDFAEDGRPSNYEAISYTENIFPYGANINYALINERDKGYLAAAGIPEKHLHLLPNAVNPPKIEKVPSFHTDALVLYPIRAIRRKNIGEIILWSLLAPENTQFAVTLPPENEQWLPYYELWDSLVSELGLRVKMGCIGKENAPRRSGSTFEDWLSAATHCVTTSVAEGFGLTYLESMAIDTPLFGRDLPDITEDFKQNGLELGALYEKLLVPIDAIDAESLYYELHDGLESTYLSYNTQYEQKHLRSAWAEITKDGFIDFGNLPEHHQVNLILKAHTEGFRKFYVKNTDGTLHKATEWISRALFPCFPVNKAHTLYAYNMDAYQVRLKSLLTHLASQEAESVTWLDRENVTEQYLSPERFHFLKA